MKFLFFCVFILLLLSCSHSGSKDIELDRLNQRVENLEHRLDSLTPGTNTIPFVISDSRVASDRCHAMTKKGTPCKRKAKASGYCWQHRG